MTQRGQWGPRVSSLSGLSVCSNHEDLLHTAIKYGVY